MSQLPSIDWNALEALSYADDGEHVTIDPKLGRKPLGDRAMTANERKQRQRSKEKQEKQELIAVLDFETDPFDADQEEAIFPFLAVFYSKHLGEPWMLWEDDKERFIENLIAFLDSLPDAYTIYAHNGGRFDFMFLIHKLRGPVSFKGRGIMSAKLGKHTLRDSFHIIPDKLASYKKDDFDYRKLLRSERHKHRDEIISYCRNDGIYLLDLVTRFVDRFGFKISIGQAAITELKKDYKFQCLNAVMDNYLRQFFFGGRVECLAGKGEFHGQYKLYDVNSMYPYVMANYQHPIGNEYIVRTTGKPGKHTCFLVIKCRNFGALVARDAEGFTSSRIGQGTFFVTIHEYRAALDCGLILDVVIEKMIDCHESTTFEKFVTPLYARRLETKALLKSMPKGTHEYDDIKTEDIFIKLILNNAYGKFAQNPRRFKENFITNIGERPDNEGWGDLPEIENDELGYAIWAKPLEKLRFNNVGTAASITGAARSVLMRAIKNAVDPIYCDTDSVICRDLNNLSIHATELGAWDIEAEYKSVIIAGKKQYAVIKTDDKEIAKQKGATGMTYDKMQKMIHGENILLKAKAPTLTRKGEQRYINRDVRATGGDANLLLLERLKHV